MLAAPTTAEYLAKLKACQATGTRAAQLEHSGAFDLAFESYLKAAQAALFLIRHTAEPVPKARLREVSKGWLERAERIKHAKQGAIGPVRRQRLSVEEQDAVVERAAVVGQLRLPRWTEADRQPKHSTAGPQPALSPAQLREGATWQRASGSIIRPDYTGDTIVQDNVDDCSLVAALIVAANHDRAFGSKIAASCLHPQDAGGLPIAAQDGVHSARLLINGLWRSIAIDDSLPTSPTGRVLSAGTTERDQIWPSLVEKAYMKAMGGYDFRGSNSSIDLYALSGWIPEHVPLRSPTYASDSTWSRLSTGFHDGRCVVTIGTARGDSDALAANGLVPGHNYAISDFRLGERKLTIVNPWRDSTGSERTGDFAKNLGASLPKDPIRVAWDVVSVFFESLYVNWDPAKFPHSDTVHCSIKKRSADAPGQSTLIRIHLDPAPTSASEICILLSRHQQTTSDMGEFLGLSVGVGQGRASHMHTRVAIDSGTTLMDSPHIFYRFKADPEQSVYDVHISHRGPSADLAFTLRVFGSTPLKLVDGPEPLPYSTAVTGKWLDRSAGGNHATATFMNNPQYSVVLSPVPGKPNLTGELSVICETSQDSSVNVKLIRARGERVTDFEERDVLAGTSKYNYGLDTLHGEGLRADSYTLVVSTFRPGDEGSFELIISSNLPVQVVPIVQEGGGMFSRTAKGSWTPGLDGGSQEVLANPAFVIGGVAKPVNLKVRLQNLGSPTPISLSIFDRPPDGERPRLLQSSGPYADAVSGVVTTLFRLPASAAGYLVVPSTFSSGVHSEFRILVYADQPVTLARLQP